MLQDFLNNNFIHVPDDASLTKLKKAVDEIVKKLNKDKSKICSYTLVAFDPKIAADNPLIEDVKVTITKFWNTFTSNAKDTPVVYIRAVILEALENLSKDATNATIIWFSAKNIVKRYSLNGKEKDLIEEFLLRIGNKIESEAAENWSAPSEMKLDEVVIDLKTISLDLVSPTAMKSQFKAAAIYSGWNNGGENPHVPYSQDVGWSTSFAERAGTGVSEVINSTFRQKIKDVNSNFELIKEKLDSAILSIQQEIATKNSLFQIRTTLLWWKEAAYSNAAKKSYRELEPGLLQFLMAKDYASYIPPIYPISVEYFLIETLKGHLKDNTTSIKVSDFLDYLKSSAGTLKPIFNEPSTIDGRQKFLDFAIGFLYGKYKTSQFKTLVGFPDSTVLTYSEIVLWLFHDFQVDKILNHKSL